MGFLPLFDPSGGPCLVQEVQSGLLGRTDLANARCVTALNFAQAEISRKHDFKELKQFFTVSTMLTPNPFNDKFIPIAPFTKHIHTAVLINGTLSRKLVEKPWRMFDSMWPSPEALARSRPYYYSRWNQQAILYPVPDAVYPIFMRVTVYPRPFSLTAPSGVSDYEWKDDLIIKLACAYLWKSFGRPDKADDYEAEVFGPLPERNGGLFASAVKQDTDMPDMDINTDLTDSGNLGRYWADPFVKTSP